MAFAKKASILYRAEIYVCTLCPIIVYLQPISRNFSFLIGIYKKTITDHKILYFDHYQRKRRRNHRQSS